MCTALSDPHRVNPHRCLLSAPHTTTPVMMFLMSSLWCLLLIFCCDNDSLFCTAASVSAHVAVKSLKRSVIKTSPPQNGDPTAVGVNSAQHVNLADFHSEDAVKYSLVTDKTSDCSEKATSSPRRKPFLQNDNQLQRQITRNDGHDLNVKRPNDKTDKQKTAEFHHQEGTSSHKQVSKEHHQLRQNIDHAHEKSTHLDPFFLNSANLETSPESLNHRTLDDLKNSVLNRQVKSTGLVIQIKKRLRRAIDSDIWLTSDGQNHTSAKQAKQIQLYSSDSSNVLTPHNSETETVLQWLCRLNSKQSCECIRRKILWYKCARLYLRTRGDSKSSHYNIDTGKLDSYYRNNQNNGKKHEADLEERDIKFSNINSKFLQSAGENVVIHQEKSDTIRRKRGITHRVDEVLINTTDSTVFSEVTRVDVYNDSISSEPSPASASGSLLLKQLVTKTSAVNDTTKFAFDALYSTESSVKNQTTHTLDGVYVSDKNTNFSTPEGTLSAFNESTINSVTVLSTSTDLEVSSPETEMYERTPEQETAYQANKSLSGSSGKFLEKISLNVTRPLPDVDAIKNHEGYHIPKQPSEFTVKIQLLSHIFTESNTVLEGIVGPTRSVNVSLVKPMFVVPQPEWSSAKQLWQGAWDFHVYTVAIVFSILSLYLAISMMRLYRMKNFLSQGYFISLTSIIFVMSFFRAFYFWIDGYNSDRTFPPILAYFLYTVPLPCITSAFSILFLALLNSTKMQLLSKRIQKPSFIGGIIAFHFLLSLITDIIVGSFYKSKVMFFVCQIAFVMWGLILFGGYIYIFRKLYIAARRRQKELERISLSKVRLQGISPIRRPPKLALSLAIKVTLITAVFGLMMAVLQVYAMTGVHSVFSKEKPSPWPWWWFQLGARIVEIGMCVTMSFVATQPFRYNQSDNKHKNWLYGFLHLSPCRRLFECDSYQTSGNHEVYWDENSTVFINVEENPLDVCNFSTTEQVEHKIHEEEMEPLNGKHCASDDKNGSLPHSSSRPQSLLISDNGFIRFRQEHDVDVESIVMTTDDELDAKDAFDFHSMSSFHIFDQNDSNRLYADMNHKEVSVDDTLSPVDYLVTLMNNKNGSVPHLNENSVQRPSDLQVADSDYMGDVSEVNSPVSEGQISEDYLSVGDLSLKPPSSINLGLSIENALNMRIVDIDINDNSDIDEIYNNSRRCSEGDVLEVSEILKRTPKYIGGKLNGDHLLDKTHSSRSSSETPDSDVHSVKTLLCRSNSDSRKSTFSMGTPRHMKYSAVPNYSDAESVETSPVYHSNKKKRIAGSEESDRNSKTEKRKLDSSFSDVCYAIDQLNTQTNQDFHYL